VTRRPIIGITGRERMPSVMVASIVSAFSAPPERTTSTSRAYAAGGAHEALPRPRELVGRRLVPGQHQGQQLVAQLAVGEGLAPSVRARRRSERMSPRSPRSPALRRLAMTAYVGRSRNERPAG
jgi:hypothetical protein